MEKENQSPEFKTRTSCRSCGGHDLEDIISLGNQKIVGFSTFERTPEVPLELIACNDCSLLQLRHTTRPDLLWNENYGYRSGVNKKMVEHLQGIAKEADQYLNPGDTVIDIGCNDGTLLKAFGKELFLVGFDPSANVLKYAREDVPMAHLINDFFKGYEHKAKVITAISMFYDLEDPKKFLNDCKNSMTEDGVLIIQQNYALKMIENCSFDNICHEHLEYYTLKSMENLLAQVGMEVFKVETNDLNGGSIRTFIRNYTGQETPQDVLAQREKEESLSYKDFANKIEMVTGFLKEFITDEVSKGKTFSVYGASTRGGTLLQACKLGPKELKNAIDVNPDKWGKIMETVGIPIISEEQARREQPDYMIIMPYWFHEFFGKREYSYLAKGGKFLVPLPEPKIYGFNYYHNTEYPA